MRFKYQAKKGPGETVEGAIEAPTQDMAVAKIIERGLVPVFVEGEGQGRAMQPAPPPKRGFSLPFGKKVSKLQIYHFTKQMRVFLKSQVPILNSLYILEGQAVNPYLKRMVQSIIEAVREGANFSESLQKFPQYFSPLYISIIKAGEASGRLDHSFNEISKYMENEMQLSQKVKSSLAYPIVMVSVGIATVIFLVTFVVPKLAVLFEDLSDGLPTMTRVLMSVSQFFARYWLAVIGVAIVSAISIYQNRNSAWQKKAVERLKKNIPVVKDVIYNQSLSRLARSLAMLLSSGVPVAESISIATPLVEDEEAQAQMQSAYRQILAGGGLEETLRKNCRFLPEVFIKMIAVGESSGRLDEILGELADDYADTVEAQTKIVTSLIEPISILVVGAILGLIVIAVLMPIFEMSFVM
jgi:type II secretory pathway component PulF